MHKHQQNYFSIRIKMKISNAVTIDKMVEKEQVLWCGAQYLPNVPNVCHITASPTCANLPNTT